MLCRLGRSGRSFRTSASFLQGRTCGRGCQAGCRRFFSSCCAACSATRQSGDFSCTRRCCCQAKGTCCCLRRKGSPTWDSFRTGTSLSTNGQTCVRRSSYFFCRRRAYGKVRRTCRTRIGSGCGRGGRSFIGSLRFRFRWRSTNGRRCTSLVTAFTRLRGNFCRRGFTHKPACRL